MAYMGMEIDRVGELVAQLRVATDLVDDVQFHLGQAELLADLPVGCGPALDEIAADFGRIADQVTWSADMLRSLRLSFAAMFDWQDVPQPVRTPEAIPPPQTGPATVASPSDAAHEMSAAQWDMSPSNPWHQVHQLSSHNSYEVPGGVQVLFDQGVRSFELDIHRHAPLLSGFASPWSDETGGANDQAMPQWHVFHAVGTSYREYDILRDGLAAVAALDTLDPITIFIDNKDGFSGAHGVDAFDQVLVDELGARLYSPAAFQARSAESTTLLGAAQLAGWPAAEELQGRIIVVLTDEVDGYARHDAQAFVAPPPAFTETSSGVVTHVPQPDAVFYNANARHVGAAEILAVHATTTMLRTYFNPRCATSFVGEPAAEAHYRAVDVGESDPPCGPSVIAAPQEVPGPN